MNQNVIFRKTAKGLEEIATRTHRLPARERSLLVQVDGKTSSAVLTAKGQALGDVAAYLDHLLAEGFIEPIEGSQPAPAAANPIDQAREALHYACHFLVDTLGPHADALTLKLESCREFTDLMSAFEMCKNAVQSFAGPRRAQEFWSGLTARLPQAA